MARRVSSLDVLPRNVPEVGRVVPHNRKLLRVPDMLEWRWIVVRRA
jgi:hypothetical protein